MLEEVFQDVYTKFKLHFYQNVFQRFATREATLTTAHHCRVFPYDGHLHPQRGL